MGRKARAPRRRPAPAAARLPRGFTRTARRRGRRDHQLHDRWAGAGGRAPARLRADEPHVEPPAARARDVAHRDRPGPARRGGICPARGRLRQEDPGEGHPRPRAPAGPPPGRARGARHRPDGGLRLRGAVSRRGRARSCSWTRSCRASATGRTYGCCATSGTFTSMARRPWPSSRGASASTSSTSGTTSRPTGRSRCPRRTGGSTPRRTLGPGGCARASSTSRRSSRTPGTSPPSRPPSWTCPSSC